MTEVKIKQIPKIPKLAVGTSELLSMAVWALVSFAAARASLFGNLAPFGTAAAAASKRENALPCAFSAIMGYISMGNPENYLRYIGAVLITFGAKLVLERFAQSDMLSVLIAGGSTAFASFGYAAMTVVSGYGSALALAETIIAMGSAYFFKRTETALEHRKPSLTLSSGDRASVIMTLSIISAALTGVTLGKISLGGIAASLLVLLFARYGKESGGAVAGIACGTVIALSTGNLSTAIPSYAVGGLFGGVFSVFGKIGTGLAFAAIRLIITLLSTEYYPNYAPFYEALIAFGAFMLIPEAAGKFISATAFADEQTPSGTTVRELVLSKMGAAAEGLSDIAAATRKVASALEHENFEDLSTVLNSSAKKHCSDCPKCSECWQNNRERTTKEFFEAGTAVRSGKSFAFDKLPEQCQRKEALLETIKTNYKEASRKNSEERRVKNIREVVTDQFDTMALFLRDTASEAGSVKSVSKKLSMGVKNVFEGRNIPLFASTCYYTADGIVNIEVSGAKERLKNIDFSAVTEELSDLCDCDMAQPVKRDTENARRLFFAEKPLMKADFGTASINAKGEKFCGDCVEHFTDRYGCANLVLSDGMGSGERAALDSMMTSALISRLIRGGFRFGSAIKLVNSALLLKSEDESLATVDAFSVNLYTGFASFYKAGAECSFILKNGKVSKVESCSLPAGILGGTEYEQSSISLSIGDTAVLITDGVTFGGSDWIPSEIRSLADRSAKEIAEGIAETAFLRRTDGHSDDITVAVIKLNSAY